jgi:hypothetical protein
MGRESIDYVVRLGIMLAPSNTALPRIPRWDGWLEVVGP